MFSRASRSRRGPRLFPRQFVKAGSSSAALLVVLGLLLISHVSFSCALLLAIAPVVSQERLDRTLQLVSTALGDTHDNNQVSRGGGTKIWRYEEARKAAWEFGGMTSHEVQSTTATTTSPKKLPPPHELVYGELSVPVLATILDAVGVEDGEKFLDVGSGDGALVMGASLLYAAASGRNAIKKARGVEIVPGLVTRSRQHANKMKAILQSLDPSDSLTGAAEPEFILGDIYMGNEEISALLADTTLAVCFATTWSEGNANYSDQKTSLQGRTLSRLSSALTLLARGARVVIIDGKLNVKDGFDWQGDLRVYCPDTAPYSTATLYKRN